MSLSIKGTWESGNDTIDRYPLCVSGVLKILCIYGSYLAQDL